MKYVISCLIALCFASAPVLARCVGDDVRDSFSSAERAELDRLVSNMPYAQGNHWKATQGDKIVHVIGTIHMADPGLEAAFTRLRPVIESADLLLVEATRAEQAQLEMSIVERPELVFLTEGPTLPELMDEQDWQALKSAAETRGVPGFMAAKFQPWYLSLILSMPGCAIRQMQAGGIGMDHLIMDHAAASGVPQQSLEPHDTLFSLMAQEPLEKQVEYLTLGVLPDDVATDAMVTMFAGYFAQETAQITEFSRILARRHIDLAPADLDALVDEFYFTLLDARNVAWMPVILDAPDGQIVIAAGAAHLPGEKGLLQLLENEGFSLERQPF